jgi:phosphate transport system substrate-binding protein
MRERPSIDRRAVLLGGGTAIASLAGCISTSPTPPGDRGEPTQDESSGESSDESSVEPLKVGGSSTVYPITSDAGSVWNSNPRAEDDEYWGPSGYDIDTDERLANYWASKYGFDGSGASPPFSISVKLSHSGTGLEKLEKGLLDLGNSSAPVAAELTNLSDEELDEFKNHVVGVDAQPIVVSREVYEAGVKQLTAEQVRKIYQGEITNWSGIDAYDGPDKEIQAVGRAEGSGTDTAFRANMLGSPDADMSGVDVRKGQNQNVETVVGKSTNAIAYMALAFVTSETPAISLEFDGKVYEPGENLAERSYPLSRDLHCYTHGGTSKQEAAFLRMIIHDFGQENYVKPAGYATLTSSRQQEELEKLPKAE